MHVKCQKDKLKSILVDVKGKLWFTVLFQGTLRIESESPRCMTFQGNRSIRRIIAI